MDIALAFCSPNRGNRKREIVLNIVHQQSCHAAVSVPKRMNVAKDKMGVKSQLVHIKNSWFNLFHVGVNLTNEFSHYSRDFHFIRIIASYYSSLPILCQSKSRTPSIVPF